MKKLWLFLVLAGVLSPNAHAWPRLSHGATVVAQNSGDRSGGISVTISSTSATKVYTSDRDDREVLLQNTSSSFIVYCGTYSAVSATSGPRWALWESPAGNYTSNANPSIWCIGEPGSGSIEILGSAEYDSKDAE